MGLHDCRQIAGRNHSSIRRCWSSEIVFILNFAASDPQLARDATLAGVKADLRGYLRRAAEILAGRASELNGHLRIVSNQGLLSVEKVLVTIRGQRAFADEARVYRSRVNHMTKRLVTRSAGVRCAETERYTLRQDATIP
jgi:hypothetical protein